MYFPYGDGSMSWMLIREKGGQGGGQGGQGGDPCLEYFTLGRPASPRTRGGQDPANYQIRSCQYCTFIS